VNGFDIPAAGRLRTVSGIAPVVVTLATLRQRLGEERLELPAARRGM
jgi:hypothetical protein